MKLNPAQQKQFNKQVKAHQHKKYTVDIELGAGHSLKKLAVHPSILRPDVMSAMQLAQWLFFNNGIFIDKTVLDMGSGTGIQGIVMGTFGAREVTFADISKGAVRNTKENVKKFNLEKRAHVYESNLFQNISTKSKFDVIVFNHPFFSDGTMEEQITSSAGTLARGSLIHTFLRDAKKFLRKDGIIVMPYFQLAGPQNDPAIQAKKHGYKIKKEFCMDVRSGLQQGLVTIHTLWID